MLRKTLNIRRLVHDEVRIPFFCIHTQHRIEPGLTKRQLPVLILLQEQLYGGHLRHQGIQCRSTPDQQFCMLQCLHVIPAGATGAETQAVSQPVTFCTEIVNGFLALLINGISTHSTMRDKGHVPAYIAFLYKVLALAQPAHLQVFHDQVLLMIGQLRARAAPDSIKKLTVLPVDCI